MKAFLSTFVACVIFVYLCFFFGGWMIFENLTAQVVLVAFIISVLITAFLRQDEQIKSLEARLKALETMPSQPDTQKTE